MYKLILLDADRTVLDFDKAEEDSIRKGLEEKGLNLDFNQVINDYRTINMELWHAYEKGEFDKKKIASERYRRLFHKYGLDLDPIEFGKIYLDNLSQCGYVLDGAVDLCKYLYNKYKVVILTNGIKSVQDSRMEASPIKDYVHDIVISDEVGVPKPHREIYEFTLNKVGNYDKNEILMIGDSLSSDIKGGQNFGIDTCWYNPGEETGLVDIKPTYEIKDLKDLYEIL